MRRHGNMTMTHKRTWIVGGAGATVIAVVAACLLWRDFVFYRHTVAIDDVPIRVRVAGSAWQQRHGLGGTLRMCATCGMYFPFDAAGYHALWMRGMIMDIDALWIANGRVVAVEERMRWRRGRAEIRAPQVVAEGVIEVPAGFVAAHDIRVGASVVGRILNE